MAINPFTLDYSDSNVIKSMQIQALNTVKDTSASQKIKLKQEKKKEIIKKEEQENLGRKVSLIFEKLDMIFKYSIKDYRIIIRIYDKNKTLILEDEIEDFNELLNSIKNDKGKIIDFKI